MPDPVTPNTQTTTTQQPQSTAASATAASTPAEPVIDDFVKELIEHNQSLADSFKKVVSDTQGKTEDLGFVPPGRPLSEIVEQNATKQAAAAQPPAGTAATTATATTPAPGVQAASATQQPAQAQSAAAAPTAESQQQATTTASQKSEEKKDVAKPKRSAVDDLDGRVQEQLRNRSAAASPTQEKKTAGTQTTAATAQVVTATEADPLAGLRDWQREELDFDKFAGEKFPEHKGKYQQRLDFFKKMEKFVADNPEATPDSDEFQKFVAKNRPAYAEAEVRKIMRLQIEEDTTQKVKKELEPKIEEIRNEARRRDYEIEMRPRLDRAVQQFAEGFTSKEGLPEGIEPIDTKLMTTLNEEGYEAAVRLDPVGAPIVAGAVTAAKSFLEINTGLAPLDVKNPTHGWLVNFFDHQSNIFMQKTNEAKRTKDGKAFMPWVDYHALSVTDPEKAKNYWTFSTQQALDMIELHAHISRNQSIKSLEQAGYKRGSDTQQHQQTQQVAQQAVQQKAEQKESLPSPKAGATISPGAASSAPNPNQDAQFLDSLVTGGSTLAGVR